MRATNTYLRRTLILILASSAVGIALTQDNRSDADQTHVEKVRQLLPPHSALPPLLDLSEPNANGGSASRDWENRFTGSMGVREHADPGTTDPSSKASISMTTTEFGGPMPASYVYRPLYPRHTYSSARGKVWALTPRSQCLAFFANTN